MNDTDDPGRPAGIVHDYAAIAKGAAEIRREREAAIAGRPPDPDMRDLIKPSVSTATTPEIDVGRFVAAPKQGAHNPYAGARPGTKPVLIGGEDHD